MQTQNLPLYHVLDDKKRAEILGLLAFGASRRKAAQFVGCAPSTITRAIQRDPQFAARVARAEQNIETLALNNLRAASKQERYWRASAWVLERRNPDDFATRQPRAVTGDQLAQTLTQITEILCRELPRAEWQHVNKLLDDLIDAARHETQIACEGPTIVNENPTNEPPTQQTAAGPSEPAITTQTPTPETTVT